MRRATLFYEIRFSVRGRGVFPLDMLRYDACHPSTSDDTAAIEPDRELPRTVHLTARKHNPEIATERWASFGWRVVEVVP